MTSFEWNVAIGVGGLILTIGLVSVLVQGFEVHKYPKQWKEELQNRYIPNLLKKGRKTNESDHQ